MPVEGPHEEDRFWIDGMPQQSKMFGFPNVRSFVPTRWLQGGDKVHFGDVELDVLHCPGHTPGHVVSFHAPSRLAQVATCCSRAPSAVPISRAATTTR